MSNNDKHLGTAKELNWFAMKMAEELENHVKEKQPLRDVQCYKVKEIVINSIRKRLDEIEYYDPSSPDKYEIEKQCVHIANYAMMLFLRSKYNA